MHDFNELGQNIDYSAETTVRAPLPAFYDAAVAAPKTKHYSRM